MKEIGFIGLGNMGSKMALHLANAGHRVYGYDINEHLVEELSVLGVLKEKSLTKLAKEKDIIITMLPNGNIVENVLKEILPHIKPKSLFLDCSTIDVDTAISVGLENALGDFVAVVNPLEDDVSFFAII